MPKNIFAKQRSATPKPKRNTFDLSHANHFTAKMGYLYPVLCQEVLPGDSFRIDASAQFKAMPLKFPVQSPINCHFHYFYVRNRILWNDWEDYITKVRDDLDFPTLKLTNERAKQMLKTGELADYLGVPTELYGRFGNSNLQSLNFTVPSGGSSLPTIYKRWCPIAISSLTMGYYLKTSDLPTVFLEGTNINNAIFRDLSEGYEYSTIRSYQNDTDSDLVFAYPPVGSLNSEALYCGEFSFKPTSIIFHGNYTSTRPTIGIAFVLTDTNDRVLGYNSKLFSYATYTSSACIFPNLNFSSVTSEGPYRLYAFVTVESDIQISTSDSINNFAPFYDASDLSGTTISDLRSYSTKGSSSVEILGSGATSSISSVADDVISDNPFVGNTPDIPLNALPFRAYEMIYNAFYRDTLNNPYFIDGVQQFNNYLPSLEGGQDTNTYLLHKRNWELDFLTSAVPSPQFGAAPLVGVTVNNLQSTATLTLDLDPLADNALTIAQAKTGPIKAGGTTSLAATSTIDEFNSNQSKIDGKLTGTIDVTIGDDGETIKGISNYSNNVPATELQRLFEAINYGISINDIRNVNSFQRFLENMIRKGSLKYRDQLMAHFGVEPDYNVVDMPSFEGGFTVPVVVNEVTQSAQTSEGTLGDIAGKISVKGGSRNNVSIYCPEHGFVMCIMSITPVPSYSQLLPKFMTKTTNALDYFFPEFSKIGYQPIKIKEVAPLQAARSQMSQDKVFGYQRPNYDYLACTDEVHGLMRSNLRDFLINRVFNSVPQLGEQFLLVDPEQVNDVFAVTQEDNDTFIGEVYFHEFSKRPIPRLGIPSLE